MELSLDVDGQAHAPGAELAMYRILQEALTNAARHGSGPARVEVQVQGRKLSLEVENPVPERSGPRTRGSGLIGMRERIAAAGGAIEAGIRGDRWVVRAVVPGEAGA